MSEIKIPERWRKLYEELEDEAAIGRMHAGLGRHLIEELGAVEDKNRALVFALGEVREKAFPFSSAWRIAHVALKANTEAE